MLPRKWIPLDKPNFNLITRPWTLLRKSIPIEKLNPTRLLGVGRFHVSESLPRSPVWQLYRPGSRKWWRGIKLQYRRVDKAPWLAEGKEVGGLVKSPVIKLACSDLQHTRIGDHRVKDEVARCKLKRPSDWRSPEQAHRQRWRWCRLWRRPARPQGRCMKAP